MGWAALDVMSVPAHWEPLPLKVFTGRDPSIEAGADAVHAIDTLLDHARVHEGEAGPDPDPDLDLGLGPSRRRS